MNKTQISAMLQLQDRMNKKVNPQWVTAGYAFMRAAMVEGVEAIGHHGWKWWKKQSLDMEQLRIELVDIWHFALSNYILQHGSAEAATEEITTRLNLFSQSSSEHVWFDDKNYQVTTLSLLECLDLLVGLAAAKRFNLRLFAQVMQLCQMDWDALQKAYVSKNVLNFFRQDHGYKEGTYVLDWGNGREDNEAMTEILAQMDTASPSFEADLYARLKVRYALVQSSVVARG